VEPFREQSDLFSPVPTNKNSGKLLEGAFLKLGKEGDKAAQW
jgi:hypothetical protein